MLHKQMKYFNQKQYTPKTVGLQLLNFSFFSVILCTIPISYNSYILNIRIHPFIHPATIAPPPSLTCPLSQPYNAPNPPLRTW